MSASGHFSIPGVVDERSITEIEPDELAAFTQCHFFAGIGVWSRALRNAGWSDDAPVWTGSCPCQPFSAAGQQKGFDDERHLWPAWFRLIQERRPPVVLGEQVASALAWLDLVSADLEEASYAFGALDLCAAGFGGAHIRQRLYFVAHADDVRPQGRARVSERADQRTARQGGVAGRLADTDKQGSGGRRVCGPGEGAGEGQGATLERLAGLCEDRDPAAPMLGRNPADWLYCRDGKWRPVEPGTFPLADAAPARVGRLRAYGNGLDLETAAAFCDAVAEALDDLALEPASSSGVVGR